MKDVLKGSFFFGFCFEMIFLQSSSAKLLGEQRNRSGKGQPGMTGKVENQDPNPHPTNASTTSKQSMIFMGLWTQNCRAQDLWALRCPNCPHCACVFPTVGASGVRVHQMFTLVLGSSLAEPRPAGSAGSTSSQPGL